MQTNTTFSVIFYTRKSRSHSERLNIFARITVNSKRSEISLKRCTLLREWDSGKNRARGSSYKTKVLNAYLDQVYSHLLDCHKQLLEEGKIITANAVKARYLGLDENHRSLTHLIAYHNTNMASVLKYGTMKNYYTTEKYLLKFLRSVPKVEDIYLKQVNYKFISDFEQFLRTYRNQKKKLVLSNNGVMKHMERFKKLVNLAVKLEWITKNPFDKFQLKFDKFDRQFLTERELQLLENTHYKNERLERIRDCFIFSCYTGLSYVDVRQLTQDQIVRGIDNSHWIFTKREKTNETVKIPILPKAMEIINKYKEIAERTGSKVLLPICSNQKTNKYLKEITGDCGIHKSVTFH